MRGLTDVEEEALGLVLRESGLPGDCRYCDTSPHFSQPDAVFLALHARGLVHVVACSVTPDAFHCDITDRGRLALRLAAASRAA